VESSAAARNVFETDLCTRRFAEIPPAHRVSAFGVDYVHLSPPEGGDLYITRFGWPLARQLLPACWYTDEWYARHGEKLPGATGHVYHVETRPMSGRRADLVVKFSRVAQYVSIVVETSFPDDVPPEVIAAARFNSPMEEFGLVMELRRRVFDPKAVRILTQRPLAIYAPAREYQLWQLGRSTSSFYTHRQLLAADQEDAVKAIELDIRRAYVLLYGWIKGRDAEQSWDAGYISEAELLDLTPRVIQELRQNGFRVLDNKPKHFILRKRRRDGSILRDRHHRFIYGLVDFEFLQRTAEHQRAFKALQLERYQRLQMEAERSDEAPAPSHLAAMRIFGVNYLYGVVQDGGRLWVVGRNPDLFEFFVPDRWRRTARLKLSPVNEVYRTRTRDNIHVVYRRSRVGSQPRIDPLIETGQKARAHGYNSPFEEVVIAERLRQFGVPTIIPRAVYRTDFPSTSAAYLKDLRRIADHAGLTTPGDEPEPILLEDYDYYTIWGYFRGFGPGCDPEDEPGVDLEQARDACLLAEADCNAIAGRAQRMLEKLGLGDARLSDVDIQVYVDPEGRVERDARGEIYATFGIDAMRSYEIGLLDEPKYRDTMDRVAARLHAADCEALDLKGNHFLLSFDVDGRYTPDKDGEPAFALCNFEFVRGLYRPIR